MYKDKKIIAIIPARGGSKRLPGKNIKLLLGKPLIYYSIAVAKASKYIDRVIVSTDDDSIATISTSLGAEVIRRPESLSTDTATTASALKHVLTELEKQNYIPDSVITLQTTNPLRPLQILNDAIEKFYSYEIIDSLLTVSLNKHKLGKIENNYYVPFTYSAGQRSQDLNPLFYENGLIYITQSSLLLKKEEVIGEKAVAMVTDELFGLIDIDEQIDFDLADFFLNKYKELIQF
jgi:CMP-N-acetylneuraminic acid synthetase